MGFQAIYKTLKLLWLQVNFKSSDSDDIETDISDIDVEMNSKDDNEFLTEKQSEFNSIQGELEIIRKSFETLFF